MNPIYGQSYINAACMSLHGICGETFELSGNIEAVNAAVCEKSDVIIASIAFNGTVSGSYLFSLNLECAQFILSKTTNLNNTELLYSILSDTLNVAVGEAINTLMEDYENIIRYSAFL